MRRVLLPCACLLSVCAALLLTGCGGTTSAPTATGQLRVKVKWPQVHSGKLIPASTQCLKVVLYQEQSSPPLQGKAIGWVEYDTVLIPRQEGETTTQTISVPPGTYYLAVSAHATEDASDYAQALGTSESLAVTLNETTECPIALAGTVTSIQLAPSNVMIYGGINGTGKIDITAFDGDNNLVLLSPSAGQWNQIPQNKFDIDADGNVQSLIANGSAQVSYTDTEQGLTSNTIYVIVPAY